MTFYGAERTSSVSVKKDCNSTITVPNGGSKSSSTQYDGQYKVEYDINGASSTKPSDQIAAKTINKSYAFG